MNILFKYTTRSRRGNFLRGIDSIVENLANKENYHILISVENEMHDNKMHPLPQLTCNHTYYVNKNAPTTKVDAINRDVNECGYAWDILVNMSDDMVFIKQGFDNDIRKEFENTTDLCVHFPDGVTQDKLISMSIIGRDYYNRFKYIYHPDYKSLYCDNEVMDVAKMLGKYIYVGKDLFRHLHPAHGNAPNDEQYIITESYHPIDFETYKKRKAINFGL